eukprot:gene3934-biopygen11366
MFNGCVNTEDSRSVMRWGTHQVLARRFYRASWDTSLLQSVPGQDSGRCMGSSTWANSTTLLQSQRSSEPQRHQRMASQVQWCKDTLPRKSLAVTGVWGGNPEPVARYMLRQVRASGARIPPPRLGRTVMYSPRGGSSRPESDAPAARPTHAVHPRRVHARGQARRPLNIPMSHQIPKRHHTHNPPPLHPCVPCTCMCMCTMYYLLGMVVFYRAAGLQVIVLQCHVVPSTCTHSTYTMYYMYTYTHHMYMHTRVCTTHARGMNTHDVH